MNDAPSTEPTPKDTRWRELGILVLVAVVLTPIFWLTPLDIVAAGWFYDPGLAAPWYGREVLFSRIFFHAPPVLIGLIVAVALWCYATGGKSPLKAGRRRAAVIMLAAVLIGPGLLVNSVFKNHWGRPRPNAIEQFGGKHSYQPPLLRSAVGGKSFPSGHVAVAFVFAVFYLLLKDKRRRLAWVILWATLLLGLAMGVARMAAGAHFLSDVLWSMLITWFAAWAVYYSVMEFDARFGAAAGGRKLSGRHRVGFSAGGVVVLAGLLLLNPVNRRNTFAWPTGVAVPGTLVLRVPDALVKVTVEPAAAGGAAFEMRQTIRGYGLPWNRLRVKRDPAEASEAGVWSYTGRASGFYTDLDNVLTITVRDPAVRVLRVETGGGAKVEVEGGKAGWLEIVEVPAAGK
jgi:membrane-associated PAP2 superfamily phosphatase